MRLEFWSDVSFAGKNHVYELMGTKHKIVRDGEKC